jgi:hypothetical protein
VYVRVPSQVSGSGAFVITGPVGEMGSPQLLVTVVGVGAVALAGQATVAEPFAGTMNGLRSMV